MTTATSARTFAPTPVQSPWCQKPASMVHWVRKLPAALARMRGRVRIVTSAVNSMSGTTSSTQRLTTARAHGLSTRASGLRHWVGTSPFIVGLMRWNRSGTPVRSASRW